MIDRFIRWLRGYVVFTLRGRFPERFLNLSIKRGNPFIYVNPTEDGLEGAMLLCDYKEIRPLARKCSVVLRHKKRVGLPFLLSRYRHRKGLFAGLVVFLILSLLMKNMIWSVEISGIETLSESAIIEELEESGVKRGSFVSSVDTGNVSRKVMQESTDIGWMSVNIIGSKAQVEIKEKVRKPEIVDYRSPCNIVASYDGLIKDMNTKQGSAMIKSGSAVLKGQLLVSGAMVNALNEIDYVHSAARVLAETKRTQSFTVSKIQNYKSPQKEIIRHRGIFLIFEFPLDLKAAERESTVRFDTEKMCLNSTVLELGMKREYITEYKEVSAEINEERAEEILRTEDALYRLFALSQCEEIKGSREYKNTPEGFSLEVSYTCLEDIAKEQNIIVN